ncbi:MAG: Xaa-Pro dipeptidase [Motiliproteus sp.]
MAGQPLLQQQYQVHIQALEKRYDELLDQCGYEGLLIHSGSADYYFRDDQQRPFRVNPYFLNWLPLDQHLNCCLWIRPGQKPRLYYFNASDFWHMPAGRAEGIWTDAFDIVEVDNLERVAVDIKGQTDLAFIGDDCNLAKSWGLTEINPQPLIAALDWHRAVKSEYEVACLAEATRIAVLGHRAVKQQFAAGASEFDLLMSYQQATGQRENQLPYGSIIALNEHGSVLHYQHYDQQPPAKIRSLLIDAGASFNGYGADITRTYSAAKDNFSALIEGLDQRQQTLVAQLSVGQSHIDLHIQMCHMIAELLQQSGLVTAGPEQQLEQGIVTSFFPHGLGHLLGLQVHDAGGLQADARGTLLAPPESHPYLRLTRKLQAGMVFTIEPGIYFIDSLLAKLKASKAAAQVNWAGVEQLRLYGGIRIEDNICLREDGALNLTRQAFSDQSG